MIKIINKLRRDSGICWGWSECTGGMRDFFNIFRGAVVVWAGKKRCKSRSDVFEMDLQIRGREGSGDEKKRN